MSIKITYFVHGTTTDNEKEISSGWFDVATNQFPDGESYEDVKARVADFLEFLKKNYDGESVAIVGHKAPQLALNVLLKGKTWEEAFSEDWRKTKAWQPGWEYILK